MRLPGFYRVYTCKIHGCTFRAGYTCPECAEEKADECPDENAEYERERDLRAERVTR